MEKKREIKFRAWDMERKKMIGRAEEDGEYTVCFSGEIRCIKHGNTPFNVTLPQSLILMQFTGLKDKKGKEIYENDVVKVVDGMDGELGIIWWNGLGWDIDWSIAKNLGKFDYSVGDSKCLEVIGNIYENPELLSKLSSNIYEDR